MQDDTRPLSPTLPPGLAGYSDYFQPLALGNRRTAMPTGTVLELAIDDRARQAVTAETPLKLHLDWSVDDAQQLFAVAQEDGLFYPVGRSGLNPQEMTIEWLPEVDEALVATPLAERRNVQRVLKLYLYRMVGWQEETLGLHRVRYIEPTEVDWIDLTPGEFLREFDGGALVYSPVDATAILPRQRVAIAVHGFSADSKTLASWLTTIHPQHFQAYDHVLAYDYESLATGINENARRLADALRALELHVRPRLRVDLFAHSMGTMISRAMVELWGGDAFVERCFLAGPPNQGTRLADGKKLVPWLAALALNGVGAWTPAAIAGWALEKLEGDAVGVEDLRPGSQFLQDLNQTDKPVSARYFILAGNNPLLPQQDEKILQLLKRRVLQGVDLALDTIFGDQNDLVINVESMLGIRDGNYPKALLKTAEVPCNHFSYFHSAESQAQLLEWLR
ncbi:MAG: alpha/beta hydrolase [Caldilineaceae bacterium]